MGSLPFPLSHPSGQSRLDPPTPTLALLPADNAHAPSAMQTPFPSDPRSRRSSIPSNTSSRSPSPFKLSVPTAEVIRSTKPWKREGYPGLCKIMASSGDAFVLRRFMKLNTRVLLSMQDEIVLLEDKLTGLDKQCMFTNDPNKERSSSVRYDATPERKNIVAELRRKLKEYNEYVITYSELRQRSSAKDYQVQNLQNWFENNPHAIDEEERRFVDSGDDLIPIISQTKSGLRRCMERIDFRYLAKIFRARTYQRVDREKAPSYAFYASNKKISAMESFIIITMRLALLLAPLWWLNKITDSDVKLKIVTGFVVLFTVILASATVERPFDVLIGSAGYAAVLMVFMQVQSSGPM